MGTDATALESRVTSSASPTCAAPGCHGDSAARAAVTADSMGAPHGCSGLCRGGHHPARRPARGRAGWPRRRGLWVIEGLSLTQHSGPFLCPVIMQTAESSQGSSPHPASCRSWGARPPSLIQACRARGAGGDSSTSDAWGAPLHPALRNEPSHPKRVISGERPPPPLAPCRLHKALP